MTFPSKKPASWPRRGSARWPPRAATPRRRSPVRTKARASGRAPPTATPPAWSTSTSCAINPLLVEGQVEGSVYMGFGEALMEEQVFRKGLHKWPSMLEYKSPTFLDSPEIETFIVETVDREGPYGAKEAGQGPLLPVPPAVCAAADDALGVWIDEIPVTPEKVIEALRRKEKGEPARYGPARFPPIPYPPAIKVEPPPQDLG